MRKPKPACPMGPSFNYRVVLGCLLILATGIGTDAFSQNAHGSSRDQKLAGTPSTPVDSLPSEPESGQQSAIQTAAWFGLPVRRISFEGVSTERLVPLSTHLAQAVGAPLNRDNLAASLRQLFSTGLFDTIQADATRDVDGVALVFRGKPRTFVGRITVDGAKGATVNAQLQRASRLSPGTRFTPERLNRALEQMKQALADNGFHQPVITYSLIAHPGDQLTDIDFKVVSGPQARVGPVQVDGDSGLTLDEFLRHAHLRTGGRVDRDTSNRALNGVLKFYQGQERLEAEIKLASENYAASADRSSFQFTANRGPVVKVRVQGANMSPVKLKRLIPIFEEGTVDEDLLNEGNRRLRDYYQRLGYFDVKVDHQQQTANSGQVLITYTVAAGFAPPRGKSFGRWKSLL